MRAKHYLVFCNKCLNYKGVLSFGKVSHPLCHCIKVGSLVLNLFRFF